MRKREGYQAAYRRLMAILADVVDPEVRGVHLDGEHKGTVTCKACIGWRLLGSPCLCGYAPLSVKGRQSIALKLSTSSMYGQQRTSGPQADAVNHPKHYNAHPSGVECITVVEHLTFNVGSAVKYLWRAGLKGSEPALTDLRKAAWYIAREIQRLENQGKPPGPRTILPPEKSGE